VVVVGGGAIGVCCAWYLSRQGLKVTLLERDEVGEGCSYGNAGLVVPSHSIPLAAPGVWQQGLRWMLRPGSPFRVKPRLDAGLLRWLWRFRAACTIGHVQRSLPVLRKLSYASLALWDELAARPGLEFGYRKGGMLTAFRTPHGFAEGTREAALLLDHGVTNQVLSAKAVLAAEPSLHPSLSGGVFFPDDAQLVPDRFVTGLAALARGEGVEVRTSTEATGFEVSDGRVLAVLAAGRRFEVDELVLAAGAASARLGRKLGLRLPMEGGKGYSVTIHASRHGPRVPLILAEDRLAVTPMGERVRLSGTLELAGEDLSVDRPRALRLLGAAQAWFREPHAVDERADVWSGLRPCTPDGLPLIGRPRRLANVIIATGHAMLGVSLAPITGRLVADLASTPRAEPDGALRPDRFE
jgi:D-amino-acid dehydrogenase